MLQVRLVGHSAPFVRGLARELCGFEVQLVGQRLHAVVVQRDDLGIEGIGLDQVGAGGQVLSVDLQDHLRPGQHQQVVVALQILVPAGEARTAVIGLLQLVALDHRAHGPVDDEDAFAQQRVEAVEGGVQIHDAAQAGQAGQAVYPLMRMNR
jgi:hypothetical protein